MIYVDFVDAEGIRRSCSFIVDKDKGTLFEKIQNKSGPGVKSASIVANGSCCDYIVKTVGGLPYVYNAAEMIWDGDHAMFIVKNLPSIKK